MNITQQDTEGARDEKKVISPMVSNVITKYIDKLSDISGCVSGWGMLFISCYHVL